MNPFICLYEIFKSIKHMMTCFYIPAFGCNLWQFHLAMAVVASAILCWRLFINGSTPRSGGKNSGGSNSKEVTKSD